MLCVVVYQSSSRRLGVDFVHGRPRSAESGSEPSEKKEPKPSPPPVNLCLAFYTHCIVCTEIREKYRFFTIELL